MNIWVKRFLITLGLLIGIVAILLLNYVHYINKLNDYFYAVHTNDLKTIQKLIDQGIDVNSKNPKSGSTALEMAIREKNQELEHLLLKNNAKHQK